MNDKNKNSRNGAVLATVLIVVVILAMISASFLSLAISSTHSFRKWQDVDEAFLTAQSAIELSKKEIYDSFYEYYIASPAARTAYKFDWFGDTRYDTNMLSLGKSGYMYNVMTNEPVLYGTADVVIEGVEQITDPVRGPCDIKITAIGYIGEDTSFELTEIVRYELGRSSVFDYGYFVNNFGWFWGSSITVTGDVRANGNFSFRFGPNIYGDAYAAINPAIGADGEIDGSYDYCDLATYYTKNYGDWLRARPGSPPCDPEDDNWKGYTSWDMGYTGDPQQYQYHEKLNMPYLGDLSEYEYIANAAGGSLTYTPTYLDGLGGYDFDNNSTTINAVYDGDGPDGNSGTADDGSLVLIGTQSDPIIIDGPVVVEGDLIIKGYYTGQGTIYVGRNTHIAGDLIALDPPEWDKPDTAPETTVSNNSTKDFLGIAAKGNTVLGNYTDSTWYNNISGYIYPNGSFCAGYETEASDAVNGYDSDNNDSNGYYFNGDYRQYDGGRYVNNETLGSSLARRYFESSINKSRFNIYADSSLIDNIDATLYNNHLIVGYVGDMTINGGIISRNEAINFTGSPMINWDIRMGSTSKDAIDLDLYLPVDLLPPRTMYWYQN